MAKVSVKGLDRLLEGVGDLETAGVPIAKMAVYEGAGVMADAIRESINALPVDTPKRLRQDEAFNVIVEGDKEDLANSLGIAEIKREEDGVRTVIGFAGYSRHKTPKYPNGVPLPMIARAIESGSSVRRKHPFVRPAANGAKQAAKAKIIAIAEKQIQKTLNGKG